MESSEFDFVYDDCDTQENEISELYSYTEHPEFQCNLKAFEEIMEEFNYPPSWQKLTYKQQRTVVMKLLEHLDVAVSEIRIRATRCILYLTQGCWAEMQSGAEQATWARLNIMTLYDMGTFAAFVELLNLEIVRSNAAVASRKLGESLADSTNLRVILSVLYLITEHMRTEKDNPDSEYVHLVKTFKEEIGADFGEEMLPVKLLGMVTQLCADPTPPHFPIKKVLLLLWKILLVYLGGSKQLKERKARLREKYSLPPVTEDTLEIIKTMRSSSPPLTSPIKVEKHEFIDEQIFNDKKETPPPLPQCLPWRPKARQKDIDIFLDSARKRLVGFSLPGDRQTITGLPQPVQESIEILKKHMYTSLAEVQAEREYEIARSPLTRGEGEVEETEAEILYKAMLPNLPQYVVALLKILLATTPTSKIKTNSRKIVAEVLPEEMPTSALQSLKLTLDVNRHEEIIVKAVAAILLLLLKHFKLNHVYQFEFMSQHLVSGSCVALVLKFFKENILFYIGAKNSIPICDFPACVIGEAELTKQCMDMGDTSVPYSWRNVFSCINLLRILNKLIKWKNARIMMLIVYKSAPILTHTLKVRHPLMQFYVLKLLKIQAKYLGQEWRKKNMKTINAIYSKVRHRLNDDWAFGKKGDVKPQDFKDEDCILRASIDRFNQRRYGSGVVHEEDLTPVDTDINSALDTNLHLSKEFKINYESWLEQEVYNNEC
nr:striatin-interacting protein 1-like [Maniola hyperantus]